MFLLVKLSSSHNVNRNRYFDCPQVLKSILGRCCLFYNQISGQVNWLLLCLVHVNSQFSSTSLYQAPSMHANDVANGIMESYIENTLMTPQEQLPSVFGVSGM